jgi:hypothetical protein
MNEIEIIRQQLMVECQHVSEVMALCAAPLDPHDAAKASEHRQACLDYLALAASHFGSDARDEVLARLAALHAAAITTTGATTAIAPTSPAAVQWRELLQLFQHHWRHRMDAINGLLERNPLIGEWRAVGRVDADSVLEERHRYGRVQTTRAAGTPPPTPSP